MNARREIIRLGKFCLVGGSGVIVDMVVLHFLVNQMGVNVAVAKFASAETALLSNFAWNHLWTFRSAAASNHRLAGLFRHFWRFHLICSGGIVFAVGLVHLLHTTLGVKLYAANLVAILCVTAWNYGLNARLNWNEHCI